MWVPEWVRRRKVGVWFPLVGDPTEVGGDGDLLLPEAFGGGFHADAPTILNSDYVDFWSNEM